MRRMAVLGKKWVGILSAVCMSVLVADCAFAQSAGKEGAPAGTKDAGAKQKQVSFYGKYRKSRSKWREALRTPAYDLAAMYTRKSQVGTSIADAMVFGGNAGAYVPADAKEAYDREMKQLISLGDSYSKQTAKDFNQLAIDGFGCGDRILAMIARNPALPAEVLREIAGDDAASVRNLVAENPSTPADVREKLRDEISKPGR